MKMERLIIQVPKPIKVKLDTLRSQGTTSSGFVRHLLENHFNQSPSQGHTGRHAQKGKRT